MWMSQDSYPADPASGRPNQPPDTLIDRVRCEFLEMPGLRLTPLQAARLWGLELPASIQLLDSLTGEGFLTKSREGAYQRRSVS